MRSTRSSLLAATALAMMGSEAAQMVTPTPRRVSSRDYTDADIERSFASNVPPQPGLEAQQRAALRREISEHNADVDRRKAEKKARKARARNSSKQVQTHRSNP